MAKKQSPRMTLEEVCRDMRDHGMSMSIGTLADGIEVGVFPFGTVVSKSETGVRNIIVMRKDYNDWASAYLTV